LHSGRLKVEMQKSPGESVPPYKAGQLRLLLEKSKAEIKVAIHND